MITLNIIAAITIAIASPKNEDKAVYKKNSADIKIDKISKDDLSLKKTAISDAYKILKYLEDENYQSLIEKHCCAIGKDSSGASIWKNVTAAKIYFSSEERRLALIKRIKAIAKKKVTIEPATKVQEYENGTAAIFGKGEELNYTLFLMESGRWGFRL